MELIGLLSPSRQASLAAMDAKPMKRVHAPVGEDLVAGPRRDRAPGAAKALTGRPSVVERAGRGRGPRLKTRVDREPFRE
jgi:hypothetical protein